MYGSGSPARKPPRTADSGELDSGQRDRVASGRTHPERIPVVVDDDPGRARRHHGVRVPALAVLVGVGDGHVEIGGGGRHRAERLAAVDAPAGLGAGGHGARAREVLTALADRCGQHDAVPGDRFQRRGEGLGAAAVSARDRDLATALHVEHRNEMHAHADRDGRVTPGQAARRNDEIVRRRDPEPAEVDRAPARRSSQRP